MMNPTRHEDTSPSYVNNYLSEDRPKRYSSIDLKSFTADFSESNSIGSGGFAEVYKGTFPGGELRAVKLLNKMNCVEDTFMAEVRTMGNTAHRNLVKLYGYCFEDNMKALVYEYMENGSLDKILYENRHGNIKWVKLYAIVIEIANGLRYLHHELDDHIIHHDIKAANVLLVKNFSAKIADFGLARIMDRDVSRVDLSQTRGTPGYNAPETWMLGSEVTFKCDVYSFGMMLFEVLGKRKNGRAENWFPGIVWKQFENGNLEHFITTCCGIAEKDKENANILCKVALWCVQDSPDLRPSMKDVVLMLEKEKLVKDPPCPSFYFRQASSPMVDVEESRSENIEREWSDKMELDPTYPQNIIAGSDDGITSSQIKTNKHTARSPNSTKHLNYLRGLDENLDMLEEKMAQLNELKSDVNHRVIVEETRLKVRTNQVNGWMQRVEAKKHMVNQILLEGRQHLEKCLSGYCPKNCRSGYKLDNKARNNIILVEELKCAGVFENVAQNQHRARFQELPENFTVGLDHVFERVVDILGKDDVQVLGLYGVGGVGKTTLLKKINNELPKRTNDFDIVLWVVISSEVNVGTVQESIRERLGLMPWPESVSLSSRAIDLFNALNMMKFLILLDDVWKELNLESIGIPPPTVQNKSKIVLTTRSLDVCGSMKARKRIEVKSLNKDDSWNLFKERVGLDTLNADREIPKLAEKVAEKCHGLPIVLITVGASMASKTNPHEWRSAISDLNKSAAMFPGIEECVFHLLKFSYDKLPSPTHQVCFLFCALFPEDYLITTEILIAYWIGARYISNFEDFDEAQNKGYNIIGTLTRTCLLENWVDKFKMHDVIREFALWIACECGKEEGKVFVKSGYALTEIPINGLRPTVVQKISLMFTNITCLEKLPNCPNLSIFCAPDNWYLTHIVDDFFLSMPALKFLDLAYSEITKVPTSICELFELEYLDLSDTNITSLPYEMRNLTKVKYLAFANTKQLRIIPRGMMMNFLNLEMLEFQVRKSGDSDKEMHLNIDELRCLNQLKYLDISISDFKDLEKFFRDPCLCNCTRALRVQWCQEITFRLSLVHFKHLRNLVISDCKELKELFFGCITNNDETEVGLFESLEGMYLENLPKLIISWDVGNFHYRKLHHVSLVGCDAMLDLTWLLLVPNLQTLYIRNCGGLQEILSSSSDESGGAYDPNIISNLKTMKLQDLPNLQSICSMNALPFQSLETLAVFECPKLRRLPLASYSASNTLKKIEVDSVEWWNGLEWENETIKAHFMSHLYVYE